MEEKINFAAVINEPGSSVKNKTGSWRTVRPKIIEKKCLKCGLCSEYCPDSAIKVKKNEIVINYDYCKGCGICVAECPNKSMIMVKEQK